MATDSINTLIQKIRQTAVYQDETAWADAQLLTHFIEHRDESAFALLVRRHGAMVFGVCLRVARNQQDAEDAFQATFLILVRKAASIGSRELIANWLYGVAYNTALKARAATLKRQAREKQVTEMPEPAPARESRNDDLHAVIDQELTGLPTKYRISILLCDLEGKSRKEAAELLGCPEGTLSSRLARARILLAKRLARHGLAVSGGALAVALAPNAAPACVPPAIANATIKTAALVAAGKATVGVISPKIAALMEGVLQVMLLAKLKIGTIGLLVGLLALGASAFLYKTATAQPTGGRQADASTPMSSPRTKNDDRARPEDELKKDARALQGKWSVASMAFDFESQPPAEIVKAVVVVFKDDAMTFQPGLSIDATEKGKVVYHLDPQTEAMQFNLPPNSKPKAILFTALEPDGKVRAVNAIYKFDGDTLTLCFGAVGAASPVEFTAKKGSNQSLWVLKRLPGKAKQAEKTATSEWDAQVHQALVRYIKDEGDAKRGPKFFRLAMLLNPVAYAEPPKISESTVFKLLGEPDLCQELGVRNADDAWVEKATKYIYVVDNSEGRTVPKDSKMAAGETIAVTVTVRDGNVVGTGWNTAPLEEAPPLILRYKKRLVAPMD